MKKLIKKIILVSVVLSFASINQITEVKAADVKYCWNKDKSKRSIDGRMLTKLTNKKGVIEEEVIQTKWTDWIDYWAVDFNYNDREELILSYDGDDLKQASRHLFVLSGVL